MGLDRWVAKSPRRCQACPHGRPSPRRRHLPLHGHRGLDRARQAAARPVRGGARRRTSGSCARRSRTTAGHEIDTQGDSFFVAFASARDAVLAAVEAQRALAGHEWPDGRRGPGPDGHPHRAGLADRRPIHRDRRPPRRPDRRGGPRRPGARLAGDPDAARGRGGGSRRRLARSRPAAAEGPRSPRPSLPGGRAGAGGRVPAAPREWRTRSVAGRGRAPAIRPPPLGSARRRRASCWSALLGGRCPAHAGGGGGGLSVVDPNNVGVIDPKTNEIVAEVPVGIRPGPIAAGEGSVWVGNTGDRTLTRVERANACERRHDHAEQPDPDRGRGRRRGGVGRARPPREAVARRSAVRPGDEDDRRRAVRPSTVR